MLCISKISSPKENFVLVKGKMLDDKFGLCAVKVWTGESEKGMKDILLVGPEKIDFDRITKDFTVELDIENPF